MPGNDKRQPNLSLGKGRPDSLPSQREKMTMAGRVGQMKNQDEVHQNQILRELFLKELRAQKLYTQYHVNPLRKGEQPKRLGRSGRASIPLPLVIALEFRQLSLKGSLPMPPYAQQLHENASRMKHFRRRRKIDDLWG